MVAVQSFGEKEPTENIRAKRRAPGGAELCAENRETLRLFSPAQRTRRELVLGALAEGEEPKSNLL